jgi:predicted adenine nucleotide alpha hydrolase (AANH) superfamily ATPase
MTKKKEKLLLHVCCAPDATVVVERLSPEYDITIFFYNPNIHPETEYEQRLTEMKKLATQLEVPLLPAEYDADVWFRAVKGMEYLPEGGKRCEICFKLRLEKTAQMAKAHQFEIFTTVLTVSPHKNAALINEIGKMSSEKFGVPFMEANFKKKDGFKRSIELSRQYHLYRQNYCGCIYSKTERENLEKSRIK